MLDPISKNCAASRQRSLPSHLWHGNLVVLSANGMLMLGHSGARTPRAVCWPHLPSISVVMRKQCSPHCNNLGATVPWKEISTDLKLIKRAMYGRAKFDLLRIRVFNAA